MKRGVSPPKLRPKHRFSAGKLVIVMPSSSRRFVEFAHRRPRATSHFYSEERLRGNRRTSRFRPSQFHPAASTISWSMFTTWRRSHRFWTEIIGLKLVGKLNPGTGYKGQQKPKMQFYSGHDEGRRRPTTSHSSKIRNCRPSRPKAGACTARRRRSTTSPLNCRIAKPGSSSSLFMRAEE